MYHGVFLALIKWTIVDKITWLIPLMTIRTLIPIVMTTGFKGIQSLMVAGMHRACFKDHKVARDIVKPISINMMYGFWPKNFPFKNLFHYKDMFGNISTGISPVMMGHFNQCITILNFFATIPSRISMPYLVMASNKFMRLSSYVTISLIRTENKFGPLIAPALAKTLGNFLRNAILRISHDTHLLQRLVDWLEPLGFYRTSRACFIYT